MRSYVAALTAASVALVACVPDAAVGPAPTSAKPTAPPRCAVRNASIASSDSIAEGELRW